jgi:hypothetical protein
MKVHVTIRTALGTLVERLVEAACTADAGSAVLLSEEVQAHFQGHKLAPFHINVRVADEGVAAAPAPKVEGRAAA